ncbi:MAG: MotA/TolQ/ExbB proton channel family protein [Chthoniobacteraceae bacterium]
MPSHTRIHRLFSPAIVVAMNVALSATVFAQEDAEASAAGDAGGHTVLQQILDGGPLIILIWIAILLTSVVMVTLIVQNIMTLKSSKLCPPPLVQQLQQTIGSGNYQEAWQICSQNDNYLANVVRGALTRVGRGKEAVEDAVAEMGLREATMMRTRNSYLSVIGVISPMIGLLGTVIGMMGAFAVLGASGIKNPQALAARIGEVLLATASGLFIAIPAFIAYYVFRNMSQKCVVMADDTVNSLLLDIPYEELSGVQIGENFSAGAPAAGGVRKVSMSLTTNCPVCGGGVAAGVNPCPHCGATLDWAA